MDGERPQTDGLLRSLHSPRALLLGVACSFLACCAAGEAVSRRDVYGHAQRFHPRISIESLHFPTVRQVTAFARRRLDRERVAVVVGGNSVFYGFGQEEDGLWTKRLQQELGDEYRVVNLGARGAHTGEFGGVTAEALAAEGYKVIYLASFGTPGLGQSYPDGTAERYRYFFWDAYQRGLLRRHPARDEVLAALPAERAKDEAFAELRRCTRIDRYASSRDLWTALSCTTASTVWSPTVRGSVFRRRNRYPDAEPLMAPSFSQMPFEMRYPASADPHSEAIVRSWSTLDPNTFKDGLPWVQVLRAAFPEQDRRRTLLVGVPDSPYFVQRLGSAERQRYWAGFATATAFLESLGFSAITVGREWLMPEFYDRCHLSAQGGRQLAAELAPKIRQMAAELGYLEGR